jgi:hypothetical protein
MSILALTSDTLIGTPATGNIEYNGQFFGTDSAGSRAQLQRLVLSTAVATTSGTSINFNSIPAWVERITVMFAGVSTSGTSNYQVQLGNGSVVTSGYLSANTTLNSGGSNLVTATSGIIVSQPDTGATSTIGALTLTLISSNTWIGTGVVYRTNTAATQHIAGSIALGGTLDRVRLTTVNGTDTFDAGSVNILYEG